MYKISYLNCVLFIFMKYSVFAFILAFIDDRFVKIVINNADTSLELIKLTIGYMLYILIHTILFILIFSLPLYFILKINNRIFFLFLIIIFFLIEYLAYLWSTSQKYFQDINGVYNFIIGLVVFGIFFHKNIKQKWSIPLKTEI